MIQIEAVKKDQIVVSEIKLSRDVSPEEHYSTFLAVAYSFAGLISEGAKGSGLEVSAEDVIKKMAADMLEKFTGPRTENA